LRGVAEPESTSELDAGAFDSWCWLNDAFDGTNGHGSLPLKTANAGSLQPGVYPYDAPAMAGVPENLLCRHRVHVQLVERDVPVRVEDLESSLFLARKCRGIRIKSLDDLGII